MNMERRSLQLTAVEVRTKDDGKRVVQGLAIPYDQKTDIGGFEEIVKNGAFNNGMHKAVMAFWNHNYDLPLGGTRNGTLHVEETHDGLAFELELPDTSAGRDAWVSIQRGDTAGVSVGMYVKKDEWSGSIDHPLRTICEAELREISLTPIPAYPQTHVTARSRDEPEGLKAWQAQRAAHERRRRLLELKEKEI